MLFIVLLSLTMGSSYYLTRDVSYCIARTGTWHCTMTVFYQTLHVISPRTWVSSNDAMPASQSDSDHHH